MNDHEMERYEAELRGAAPAPLPENFMARLQAAKPGIEPARRTLREPAVVKPQWLGLLRWLAPATALAAVGLFAFRTTFTRDGSMQKQPLAVASGFKADDVKLDENLVSSFDVVAVLPGGQPVRFRCRKWSDELVATDTSHGVTVEQNNQRVEVVPVRYETY